MNVLMCPVCKSPLINRENIYVCKNNHSFDVSKKGYVNLLMSNASGDKRHGDDKMMAKARTDFLNLGYYSKLSEKIESLALSYKEKSMVVFECGCGECYYLENVSKRLQKNGSSPKLYGMDISKEVLPAGKKRLKEATLFVASAFKIPILDNSVDIALSIFAPHNMSEMSRILKKGGMFIKVIPLEDHLIELKNELYEKVYKNRPVIEEYSDFEIKSSEKLEYKFWLSNKDEIESLFKMTPYYYKTSKESQEKLLKQNNLEVTASFNVTLYIKR